MADIVIGYDSDCDADDNVGRRRCRKSMRWINFRQLIRHWTTGGLGQVVGWMSMQNCAKRAE